MKTVVLGITASIAAYKSLELTRELVKRDIKVIPILSPEAKYFVTPLSLESLSSHKTYCDFFAENESIVHISIMNEADLIALIPATANTIGKLAHGIVDNLLLGITFAADKPVLIAPAMNTRMWHNPILQANVRKLKELGYHFVGPTHGELACKEEGLGRLEELDVILEKILSLLEEHQELLGKKVLVTLGRTKEYLDPVRFISNDSSGRFGLEIARAAQRRGANVSIITGFTDIQISSIFKPVHVKNTKEMEEEILKSFQNTDILIMNAACSDFTPKRFQKNKIKKDSEELTISLVRTNDILSLLKPKKGKQLIVGFSLDTKDNILSAKKKMKEKGLDIIVANPAITAGSKLVEMAIITGKNTTKNFKEMTKSKAAEYIIKTIISIL